MRRTRRGLFHCWGAAATLKNPPRQATVGGEPGRWHRRGWGRPWGTMPPGGALAGAVFASVGRQGDPGEETHQGRSGAGDGPVGPLALGFHSQMSPHLLEGDLQLPAQHKPFQDLEPEPLSGRCRGGPGYPTRLRGSRTSTQRIGTGGLPQWYQTAVWEASSTTRTVPSYQATGEAFQETSGKPSCSFPSCSFRVGRRAPFTRGRPFWPGRRGGAGA